MNTHLLLAFGKDSAGLTLAVIFAAGMLAWAFAAFVTSRGSSKWR